LDVVGFVEMRFRRGDACGPLGVVGEQEQAFAGFIEPADRCDPGKIGAEKFVDRVAAFFVGGGRDDSANLLSMR
jgi:hypothetical protein